MFQPLKLLFPSLGYPNQSFTKLERTCKETKSHWCGVFASYCYSALAITVTSDTIALRKYSGMTNFWLLLHFSNCSPGAQWVPCHVWNKYPDPLYQPGLVTIIRHHDHIHGDLQWATRMLKLFLCKYKPINLLALELDIYVKCEYFTNQKGNVMKYTTFCRGIN